MNAFTDLEQLIKRTIPGFSLTIILIGIICIKALLSMGAVFVARSSLPIESWIQIKYLSQQSSLKPQRQQKTFISSLSKYLSSFWFLFPLITITVFSWWRDDPLSQKFLMITGYLAQGILFMTILRLINFQHLISYLERNNYYRISSSLRTAFINIMPRGEKTL